MEALLGNRIDAGILRMPADRRGLGTLCIQRDRFLLALPADYPLARQDRAVVAADLDAAPFIMFAPIESRYNYDRVSGILRSADVSPVFVQYTREIHTMLALVGPGVGLALVPESAGSLTVANVRLREIGLSTRTVSEFTLAWKKDPDSPALRRFIEAAARAMEAPPGPPDRRGRGVRPG